MNKYFSGKSNIQTTQNKQITTVQNPTGTLRRYRQKPQKFTKSLPCQQQIPLTVTDITVYKINRENRQAKSINQNRRITK